MGRGGGGWVGGQRKIRQFERDLRSKITIEHPLLSHLGAPATPAAPLYSPILVRQPRQPRQPRRPEGEGKSYLDLGPISKLSAER